MQKTGIKAFAIVAFTVFLSVSLPGQISLTSLDGRGSTPTMSAFIDLPSAVPNAPFSAKVTARFRWRLLDDSTKFHVYEASYTIARDANGRTGHRWTVGDSQLTTHIYDPATRLDTTLVAEKHIAWQRKLTGEQPEYETNPKYTKTPMNAEPPFIIYGEPVWRKEDLGTKMMEGVTVHGVRLIRNIPASASGTGQPVETADEFWYSDELRINLLVKHTDPRGEDEIVSITQVKRGDPDPQLFQIPEGFRIVDITPKATQKSENRGRE